MGPFDVIEGLYDDATAVGAKHLAEENRRRIERIEAALGIGPPPPQPPPPSRTEVMTRALRGFYEDCFDEVKFRR